MAEASRDGRRTRAVIAAAVCALAVALARRGLGGREHRRLAGPPPGRVAVGPAVTNAIHRLEAAAHTFANATERAGLVSYPTFAGATGGKLAEMVGAGPTAIDRRLIPFGSFSTTPPST